MLASLKPRRQPKRGRDSRHFPRSITAPFDGCRFNRTRRLLLSPQPISPVKTPPLRTCCFPYKRLAALAAPALSTLSKMRGQRLKYHTFSREVMIKSSMQIAQTDFSCNSGGGFRRRKIRKQDAYRDLFSASPECTRRSRRFPRLSAQAPPRSSP